MTPRQHGDRVCPDCGGVVRSHRVYQQCESCGWYARHLDLFVDEDGLPVRLDFEVER